MVQESQKPGFGFVRMLGVEDHLMMVGGAVSNDPELSRENPRFVVFQGDIPFFPAGIALREVCSQDVNTKEQVALLNLRDHFSINRTTCSRLRRRHICSQAVDGRESLETKGCDLIFGCSVGDVDIQ